MPLSTAWQPTPMVFSYPEQIMAPCISGTGRPATTSNDAKHLYNLDLLILKPEFLPWLSTNPELGWSHARPTKPSRFTKRMTQQPKSHIRSIGSQTSWNEGDTSSDGSANNTWIIRSQIQFLATIISNKDGIPFKYRLKSDLLNVTFLNKCFHCIKFIPQFCCPSIIFYGTKFVRI